MNIKAFAKYLETGEHVPVEDAAPVPTVALSEKQSISGSESCIVQDAAVERYLALDAAPIDLAAHDKRFHPNGYDPKRNSCGLRDGLKKNDKADAIPMSGTDIELPDTENMEGFILESRTETGKWKPIEITSNLLTSLPEKLDEQLRFAPDSLFSNMFRNHIGAIGESRGEFWNRNYDVDFDYRHPREKEGVSDYIGEWRIRKCNLGPMTERFKKFYTEVKGSQEEALKKNPVVEQIRDEKDYRNDAKGITTYTVKGDKEGSRLFNQVVKMQWGVDPKRDWLYNSISRSSPKQLAFRNGKLIAIESPASDGNYHGGIKPLLESLREKYPIEWLARDILGYSDDREWLRHMQSEHEDAYEKIERDLAKSEETWWDEAGNSFEGIPIQAKGGYKHESMLKHPKESKEKYPIVGKSKDNWRQVKKILLDNKGKTVPYFVEDINISSKDDGAGDWILEFDIAGKTYGDSYDIDEEGYQKVKDRIPQLDKIITLLKKANIGVEIKGFRASGHMW